MIQTHPAGLRWAVNNCAPRSRDHTAGHEHLRLPRCTGPGPGDMAANWDQAPPLAALIGRTPLIRLTRVTNGLPSTVGLYVKLEGLNPGGSIKDRAALYIVDDALRSGALAPGKTLLDATSGNTGIAYAMLGAAIGFPVELALASNVSPERLQVLRAYGARLILTAPEGRTDGARQYACALAASEPERYFYADQYTNSNNPLAHYCTTGPEIWEQTEGQLTHFVAGMGTSGTMMGAGRYLREKNPTLELIGVQPEGPGHGIEGLRFFSGADVSDIYDQGMLDHIAHVRTDGAQAMARCLAREEGIFVGVSAGAAVVAALDVARKLDSGLVAVVLPDGGFKYASAPFWQR